MEELKPEEEKTETKRCLVFTDIKIPVELIFLIPNDLFEQSYGCRNQSLVILAISSHKEKLQIFKK